MARTIINEPKPDWVLLLKAPFYCFSGRYISSAQEWADALQAEVREITQSDEFKEQYSGPDRFPPVEWSFESTAEFFTSITAMDIQTEISPGWSVNVFVSPWHATVKFGKWSICGTSDEMLSDQNWNHALRTLSVDLDEARRAEWHRQLLKCLFRSWQGNFARAIKSGAAHIMARKGSVLAPFERITWNQWQYFRLDRLDQLALPAQEKWGNPKLRSWERGDLPSTAFGPTDERLYEIHITPGVNRPKSDARNPEENCLEWLAELIHHHPDRPPKPRDALAQDALSKFPGLTQNGFLRCFTQVQVQTQNRNWSRAGRFPKSPQKLLQQK